MEKRSDFVRSDVRLGTILIEAAMIGANIQPGVNRNFVGENFHFIPKQLWAKARQEAIEGERNEEEFVIYGSDNPEMIALAKENAQLAGVEENIFLFEVADIKDIRRKEYGFLITNPPYGERIGELKELEFLCIKDWEGHFKKLKNWSFYVITSYER